MLTSPKLENAAMVHSGVNNVESEIIVWQINRRKPQRQKFSEVKSAPRKLGQKTRQEFNSA